MKHVKRYLAVFLAVFLTAGLVPVQAEAASVKMNAEKKTVYAGSSTVLKVTGTTKKAKWSSDKKSVATVNCNGKVTAIKAGKATITAKIGRESYQCRVTVKNPYLNRTKMILKKGAVYKLKLTGSTVKSWSSSNKKVAVVSSKGKITAKGNGTAAIICRAKNGESYQCKLTVNSTGTSAAKPDSKSSVPTEKQAYKAIMAKKQAYPEGKKWTNAKCYVWKGGIFDRGYGCAAFAFAMSDAAFGKLPARMHKVFSRIKVGDLIRLYDDTHFVVVLKVSKNEVTVAEGNYNNSIHWGRKISRSKIKKEGDYVLTRYPK